MRLIDTPSGGVRGQIEQVPEKRTPKEKESRTTQDGEGCGCGDSCRTNLEVSHVEGDESTRKKSWKGRIEGASIQNTT